jgi:hypothetical protein
MTSLDKLRALATAGCLDDEHRARVLAEIRDPNWGCLTATIGDPDWGDFIPDVIADRWGELSDEIKLMLFIVAKGAADRSPGWDARGEDR